MAIDHQLPITNGDFDQYACVHDAIATSEEPPNENGRQYFIDNNDNSKDSDGNGDEPEDFQCV